MTDGFLGRWSRRKQEVREGKPLAEPVPLPPVADSEAAAGRVSPPGDAPVAPAAADPPPPTLQDARALTPASDFKPFMAQGVTADVRNAAVKKLFADPHFNVMDRLDIYIDDYGQPDPLPMAMLRQMASAKFLNLFDDHGKAVAHPLNAPTGGDDADTLAPQDMAQSGPDSTFPDPPADAPDSGVATTPTETDDAHPDMRLQPDHASQRESAGPDAA